MASAKSLIVLCISLLISRTQAFRSSSCFSPRLNPLLLRDQTSRLPFSHLRLRQATNGDQESNGGSLLNRMSEYGQSLKQKGLDSSNSAGKETETWDKIRLQMKAYMMFTGYILYRAYRGFFVILPEVFRAVYRKMKDAVNMTVFDDEFKDAGDLNLETGKTRLRTRVTVSVLASIITAQYVVTGMLRVCKIFLAKAYETKSLSKSFLAAVNSVESNEDRILRIKNTR